MYTLTISRYLRLISTVGVAMLAAMCNASSCRQVGMTGLTWGGGHDLPHLGRCPSCPPLTLEPGWPARGWCECCQGDNGPQSGGRGWQHWWCGLARGLWRWYPGLSLVGWHSYWAGPDLNRLCWGCAEWRPTEEVGKIWSFGCSKWEWYNVHFIKVCTWKTPISEV